jgi:hypothetical protein
MRKEFVMRGQLDGTSGKGVKRLNIAGKTKGYAVQITEFQLYPGEEIGSGVTEACGSIARGGVALDPIAPNFNNSALVAVAKYSIPTGPEHGVDSYTVINDLALITQDLFIYVIDTGGNNRPVNFQVKFRTVKLNDASEAAANYQAFTLSD